MPYQIAFLRNGRVTAAKDWTGSLADARSYAEELFAANPRLRIEIRNPHGDLIFYRPKDIDRLSSDG